MNLIKPYWTPQYLADRARFSLREKVHPDWPWLTTGAVRFLELWLTPNDAVFEWGSGRILAGAAGSFDYRSGARPDMVSGRPGRSRQETNFESRSALHSKP